MKRKRAQPHPTLASLPELVDSLIHLMPHTADVLAGRLGLKFHPIENPSDPPTYETRAALALEDGTRITRTVFSPAAPERAGWTGLAVENASLTLSGLRQRRTDLQLVSAPAPNGSGDGRAWVVRLEVPEGFASFCFKEGEETVSAINFRTHVPPAENRPD